MGVDSGGLAKLLDDCIEDLPAELWVRNLSSAELQRDLHLVSLGEELLHVANLRVEVGFSDLRLELHLFHGDLDGLLARFLQSLRLLVAELSVVHDSTHGWIRLGRHLDQVEVCRPCTLEGVCDADDANLGTVGIDQTHFTCANAIVEPWLLNWRCYGRTLLCKWRRLLLVETCQLLRARA